MEHGRGKADGGEKGVPLSEMMAYHCPSFPPDSSIRHGGGKGLMRHPPRDDQSLYGQIREPRSGSDSEETSEAYTSERTESSAEEERTSSEDGTEDEGNEEEELEEADYPPKKKTAKGAYAQKTSKSPLTKKEPEPVEPREGHPDDLFFQESARFVSKADVRCEGYLDYFYEALVPVEYREEIPRDMVRLRAPTIDDRAHDSRNGVAIYWKMPHCGFRLKLSPFVRRLLRELDLAPAQILPAGWCYISSFEEMFKQFSSELGGEKPTTPVFWAFFSTLWSSASHTGIRKITKSKTLFDTSLSKKWNKFDEWNYAWVYLENPDDFDCWRGVRREWRRLERVTKKSKKESTELQVPFSAADKHRMELILKFVEC